MATRRFSVSAAAVTVIAVVSAASLPAPVHARQPMTVWTAGAGSKIQPTTAPGVATSIQLEGLRGSYEAAQIVVRAGASPLSAVNMSAGDLVDGLGHTIPATNITFFRQYFIDFTGVTEAEPGNDPVPAGSPTGDSWLPDPLIPFVDPYSGADAGAPFTVAAGSNQPVWVDLFVPPGTAAGTYTGDVVVTATGQSNVTVPLTLVVWNIDLPDMGAVTTHFGLATGGLLSYHRDIYDCSGESCWLRWDQYTRTLVKRYEELAHAHRIDTGQHFYYDPNQGCTPPADWGDYDAAIAPYLDGTYFADGVPSSRLDTPFTPGAPWGIEDSCNEQEYTALAAAWASHLQANGWFDPTVVYALDEPDPEYYDDIALHSGWMQAGDSGWKAHIMDTVAPTPGNVATLNPALGIYCVCIRCYDHWVLADTYGRAEWPGLRDQGIELWFYESNAQGAPFPTFATNTLLGNEPRIMMWGAWYEGATGFLLWETLAWTDGDPWGVNVDWGKTGDGVLIYPGHHDGLDAPAGSPPWLEIDGPIPSYRLKMVRAGLQDWALLQLAAERGLEEEVRQRVADAYGQMGACEWAGCPPPENGSFFWHADDPLMTAIRHDLLAAVAGTLFADGFESGDTTAWTFTSP